MTSCCYEIGDKYTLNKKLMHFCGKNMRWHHLLHHQMSLLWGTHKTSQLQEGPAKRGKSWTRENTRRPEEKLFPFHVWLAQNWIGQRDYLASDVCKKIAHSQENCSENKIAHEICSQWANLLWAKICWINLLTENQMCSQRIKFAHGESWIALRSTCNLSTDSWHDFYLHSNCSKRRKFAHSKEKLLTKIKFAPSKNLLKKFAHSRNWLTEFARRIENCSQWKTLLARMDQQEG